MYWNNPIIEATVNSSIDPVAMSQKQHCLFYDPGVPLDRMVKLISLQDTCNLANQYLKNFDLILEPGDVDKIANIVRINQFVHSLRQHGNFKPVLLNYTGTWPLGASTGGSRVMAAERIPELQSLPAFISTHNCYKDEFTHLEEITTLEQFAKHCHADNYTQFYFRLTDNCAEYGIDWYEVALESTSVPGNEQCLAWLRSYIQQQPQKFEFTPEWFDQEINWTVFDHH